MDERVVSKTRACCSSFACKARALSFDFSGRGLDRLFMVPRQCAGYAASNDANGLPAPITRIVWASWTESDNAHRDFRWLGAPDLTFRGRRQTLRPGKAQNILGQDVEARVGFKPIPVTENMQLIDSASD